MRRISRIAPFVVVLVLLVFLVVRLDAIQEFFDFGSPGAEPVQADYDGDGVDDFALYYRGASSTWYVRRSSDGVTWQQAWGWSDTDPVPGDYDGDGEADVAVYHQAQGIWYIRRSSDGQLWEQPWGWSEAAPVPGDYDGDGITDIAVYYQAGGIWYIRRSSNGTLWEQPYGWSAAEPVPGDYDGDNVTDIAVYYAAGGMWYIRYSSGGNDEVNFGYAGPLTAVADYDGDGMDDPALFDPVTGVYYMLQSTAGYRDPHFPATAIDGLPAPGAFEVSGTDIATVFHANVGGLGRWHLDVQNTDSDGDAMPDWWERVYGLSPADPGDALEDLDGDGWNNLNEWLHRMNPENADQDNDGLLDGWEMIWFEDLDENGSGNPDGDAWSNQEEYDSGLNPTDTEGKMADNDGDRYPNVYEVAHGTRCDDPNDYPAPDVTVPGPGPDHTLQTAINMAVAQGEYAIVLVQPGTYGAGPEGWETVNRNLDFRGGKLMFISEAGADSTIIDCAERGRGFYFDSGENEESLVSGFTVCHGQADYGAGIYCRTSSPSFTDCVIVSNTASVDGGGMYLLGSNSEIVDCTVSHNKANGSGGGIYANTDALFVHHWEGGQPILWSLGASPCIVRTVLEGNKTGGTGGALFLAGFPDNGAAYWTPSIPKVYRSAIRNNVCNSADGSAVHALRLEDALLENCIVSGNAARGAFNSTGELTIRNCTIARNSSSDYGAGIRAENIDSSHYTRIINTVVWGNAPDAHQVFALIPSDTSGSLL